MMSETLTLTPEQTTEPSVEIIEGLAQSAIRGAVSAAEQGSFTLSADTEAELQTLFEGIDPSAPELPLSAHGLGCSPHDKGHSYLLPPYKLATE